MPVTALPAVFERPWGLVAVRGPDATSFLQALVSQDLEPVGEGETVAALLLHPQGKLDVAFRATRLPADRGDTWWLDTDADHGPRLAARLASYRIRVKVDVEDRTAATALASVVGQAWAGPVPDTTIAIPTTWGDDPGTDVIGDTEAVRAFVAATGLRPGTDAELEALRIAAGIPRLGVDVDETTIPQEAFLERDAVSFTKGCFVGQELVCRIDTRGHVNRYLRRLSLPGDRVPPRGAALERQGAVVGTVTSAAEVPGEGRVVALGMVRREVEPPAELVVRWGDTEAVAEMRA